MPEGIRGGGQDGRNVGPWGTIGHRLQTLILSSPMLLSSDSVSRLRRGGILRVVGYIEPNIPCDCEC